MSAFGAPGESPPPLQRNGIASNSRRDVVQTMVSDIRQMLKSQEGGDGRRPPVSVTRAPSAAEYAFTVS